MAIEPLPQMLEHLADNAPGAFGVLGTAEVIPLPDAFADVVTSAQSFHWFDLTAALSEFRRILRPQGWCAAFWNMRARTPFLEEYDRLLQASSTEYEIMRKQDEAPALLRGAGAVVGCREAEFVNRQLLDLEGLLGRAYSSSCVKHGVADPAAFDRAMTDLFERYEQDGRVEFRYRTVALCWRVAVPPAARTA